MIDQIKSTVEVMDAVTDRVWAMVLITLGCLLQVCHQPHGGDLLIEGD